jgi:hypothetical protein
MKNESSPKRPTSSWVRCLASLAVTAACAYLSLASSPECFAEFGVPAEKPLHFEPGQSELRLRVTVEGANVRLTFADPFDLSSPGFRTEPAGSDGGTSFPDLDASADVDASAEGDASTELGAGPPDPLCGRVEGTPRNDPPEGTLVPRDTVCELRVIRRDASTALSSFITARALSDCKEFPEYGISIEIVE